VTTASANLLAVHNSMNNFYNEPPFALRLEQISSQYRVPVTAQNSFVQAVVTCAAGNPWGVCHAATPYYEKMVKSFSPNEIAIMLAFPETQTVIGMRVKAGGRCRKGFAHLVSLISPSSIPTQSRSVYEFWIKESRKP
jgi:hypothetical protein